MNTRRSPGNPVPPTHEQIAALAHEIWEERGRPEGSDIDIWLEAERQLTGDAPSQLPSHRDPIPADPARADADSDVAVNPGVDRELGRMGRPAARPSPTAFSV